MRVENVEQSYKLLRFERRTSFETNRIADPSEVFDMRTVDGARPVSDPDEVGGRIVVRLLRSFGVGAVCRARESGLVFEHQTLARSEQAA